MSQNPTIWESILDPRNNLGAGASAEGPEGPRGASGLNLRKMLPMYLDVEDETVRGAPADDVEAALVAGPKL